MDVRVDGKVALVTGGSRGIGEAVARELVAGGAAGVTITGRRGEPLTAAAQAIDAARVHAVAGNVSDDGDADAAVRATVERFGALDILVNNAGTNPSAGPLTDVDMGAVDKTWAVNLRAPLVLARAAWHAWLADHGGAVVNIGSVGGIDPAPLVGAYNVSKAALHYLTRQLALELSPGVRVNAVAGGVIRTRLSTMLWERDPDAAGAQHPLGRLGTPEDIARAVVFLASDAADWITGVVLPVDGGLSGASPGLEAAAYS